ncbi:unnamed protein product [Cyprideis torosa]|uniref:Uncharacterized protein n=1 Tax=Cyprideis torosa TaxID=163714 RepID=A0A7R8ZQE6_9CRUS|nr:unnamed protein product [Cyprideis torosa]CAG0901196.1 unnamed protein product [Cyprideis torosa]
MDGQTWSHQKPSPSTRQSRIGLLHVPTLSNQIIHARSLINGVRNRWEISPLQGPHDHPYSCPRGLRDNEMSLPQPMAQEQPPVPRTQSHGQEDKWKIPHRLFPTTNEHRLRYPLRLPEMNGVKGEELKWAEYSAFRLHSEKDEYKLEIGGYQGTAGDSLNDPWYGSNLSFFSTFDRDNDRSSLNCASMLKGGWWWRSCGRGLNGIYITDPHNLQARQGKPPFHPRPPILSPRANDCCSPVTTSLISEEEENLEERALEVERLLR